MGVLALTATLLTVPLAAAQDPAEDTTTETVPAEAPEEAPAEGAPAEGGDAPPEDAPAPEGEDVLDAATLAALEGPESPWSLGLIMSTCALAIGGISAVLGIWIDRDQQRPIAFAAVMSVLICAAVTVGMTQSYLDAVSAIEQKQDLKRMLGMVSEIAVASGNAELANIVQAESGSN